MNKYNDLIIKNLEKNLSAIIGNLEHTTLNIVFNPLSETFSGKFNIDLGSECFSADSLTYIAINELSHCYVEFSFDLSAQSYDLSLLLFPLEANDICPSIHAYFKELILWALLDSINELLLMCVD